MNRVTSKTKEVSGAGLQDRPAGDGRLAINASRVRPDLFGDRAVAGGVGMRAIGLHQLRVADHVEEEEGHQRYW